MKRRKNDMRGSAARVLWALLAAGAGAGVGAGVELAAALCTAESQCDRGYWCDAAAATCRECLRCERLGRAAPPAAAACLHSVADCGDCLPGLVEDLRGEVAFRCVPAGALAGGGGGGGDGGGGGLPPSYLWVLLGVGFALLVLIVAAVAFVMRKTDTFKILTSTRASVQSPCPRELAPPPPYAPPYAPPYEPVRASSPPPRAPTPPPPQYPGAPDAVLDEDSRPFIKAGPTAPAREAERRQAARWYAAPHYVRGPPDAAAPGPDLTDDDTMESQWTPAEPTAVVVEPVPPPAPALPEPRDEPPGKQLCVRQDSNNNMNRPRGESGEGPSGAAPAPARAPAAPALSFNITVQQHNDFKLCT